jgi:hypothetical protein
MDRVENTLPLLLYSLVAVETSLYAEPSRATVLYSYLFRGRCLETGLHATICYCRYYYYFYLIGYFPANVFNYHT